MLNLTVEVVLCWPSWTVHKPLVFGGTGEERSPQLPYPSTRNTEENRGGTEHKRLHQNSPPWWGVSLHAGFFMQVLEQSQYELVVPLTLLFFSALLRVSLDLPEKTQVNVQDCSSWNFSVFSRFLTCLQSVICCRRLTSSSTGSCPGLSPAAPPANGCSASSSRSSEHQVQPLCWRRYDNL